MNAWTPVPVLVLARERVAAVFPVASAIHGVAWIHAKAWGRLTPVRAAVICELTCGGFCDDSRESVIVIVSEIAHQIQRAWSVCQMNPIFSTRSQNLRRTMVICGDCDAANRIAADVLTLTHMEGLPLLWRGL